MRRVSSFFGNYFNESNLKIAINVTGIFVFHFCYGVVQERIMIINRYGNELNRDGTRGERYTFAVALVGVLSLAYCLFAKVILMVRKEPKDTTHQGYYSSGALVNLLGGIAGYMSLQWVNYPTQVLAKSTKPISVLIMGVLLAKKSYKLTKYFFVLIIVTGVGLFIYNGDNNGATTTKKKDLFGIGECLLVLSLMMDGLLGVMQDSMRATSKPSAMNFMFSTNLWGTGFLGVALIASGEGMSFLRFVNKHPSVLHDLSMLVVTGCIGQVFIYMLISQFGALITSIVTTTRKFFTVLFSVLYFGNHLTTQQWIATGLVFCGLFADIVFGTQAEIDFSDNVTEVLLPTSLDKFKNANY